MSQAAPGRRTERRGSRPWARRTLRAWTRPDGLPCAAAMLAAIPSLPRAVLARLTERMINRMDEIDGDAVREDGVSASWEDHHG